MRMGNQVARCEASVRSSVPRKRAQAETMLQGPTGIYLTAGMVTRIKAHKDRNGNAMGFLDIETEAGLFSMAALSDLWTEAHHQFKSGTLALVARSRQRPAEA